MPKFTPEENKRHWDKYAKQHKKAPEGVNFVIKHFKIK